MSDKDPTSTISHHGDSSLLPILEVGLTIQELVGVDLLSDLQRVLVRTKVTLTVRSLFVP